MANIPAEVDVLIVGAGPTGLALALWLTRLGVRVRIVDREITAVQQSRAIAVQARTLELYRQVDLTAAALELGYRVPAMNLWVEGQRKAHVPFTQIGAALSPYGPLTLPQDQHERLLCQQLQSLGVIVERSVELLDFDEQGDVVLARLRLAQDRQQTCRASYLAGCDGASSRARGGLGIGFSGGTYQQLFYVADIEGSGPAMDGELHVDLDEADFLAVFPIGGSGHARLVGTVRDERAERPEQLQFADVSERAIRQLSITDIRVKWFSSYRVHHRVADHFRQGRVLLLGDAAHVHSPAGGQGMNTGIGDAVNLAWKLAAVLGVRASRTLRAAEQLLATYESERQAFARRLVASTDRGFTLATAEGPLAHLARTRLVPLVVPALFRLPGVREYLFSTVSQLTLNYRDSPLSAGSAGEVHGGDRLPWVAGIAGQDPDNYESLRALDWQVHVYGTAEPALLAFCASQGLAVREFSWCEACASAGLTQQALYLVRPDGYLSLVHTRQDTARLLAHLQHLGIAAGADAINPSSAGPAQSR
ncbi:MAG TPA: FAD-dependent monooxygenase [Steroidobacteraceae bacterium]|jgi:2-polyprenyl-6-methoxyphenol hydroxylase-like FAD-dependent oxidoreductase|nr:FAD-dependent monooxygenase [Steroidobacteraceae bacterium]